MTFAMWIKFSNRGKMEIFWGPSMSLTRARPD